MPLNSESFNKPFEKMKSNSLPDDFPNPTIEDKESSAEEKPDDLKQKPEPEAKLAPIENKKKEDNLNDAEEKPEELRAKGLPENYKLTVRMDTNQSAGKNLALPAGKPTISEAGGVIYGSDFSPATGGVRNESSSGNSEIQGVNE